MPAFYASIRPEDLPMVDNRIMALIQYTLREDADINGFWVDSVHRGVAARQLGQMVDSPVEEAFSAGMLLDMGLLALFLMAPEKADRWPLLRPNLPGDRRRMENELFRTTHDRVGAMLAEQWHLPETYGSAIHNHHSAYSRTGGGKAPRSPLTGLVLLADLCNAVYTCHDKARALKLLKQQSKQLFRLTPADVERLLSGLPDQVREATELMRLKSGTLPDFHTVMDRAKQRMA